MPTPEWFGAARLRFHLTGRPKGGDASVKKPGEDAQHRQTGEGE
jgi:hypothetical protein